MFNRSAHNLHIEMPSLTLGQIKAKNEGQSIFSACKNLGCKISRQCASGSWSCRMQDIIWTTLFGQFVHTFWFLQSGLFANKSTQKNRFLNYFLDINAYHYINFICSLPIMNPICLSISKL